MLPIILAINNEDDRAYVERIYNQYGKKIYKMDSVPSGFYQHYHLIGANGIRGLGKFAHFHVWFGPPMP